MTPERLAKIRAYLADVGPNEPNDPERYVVIDYLTELLAEVEGHRCGLPTSIVEALNSGDGTYHP